MTNINKLKNHKIGLLIGVVVIIIVVMVVMQRLEYVPDGANHRIDVNTIQTNSEQSSYVNIPTDLQKTFSKTDWSFVDSDLERALSGGPGKDGIPSIDKPKFESVDTFKHPDSVQAIVVQDGGTVKVFPYNILNWHEIVNDTVGGVPVAVTFCPLCGSAVVYDRRVNGEILTFGVSGFLLESNMIMFDRENEALWQQSTGKVLAGRGLNTKLELAPFQLMTMSEVKKTYPNAQILSEDTGYRRDYGRNPYSGYEDSEGYIFSPSREDARYPSKTIFVVFRYGDKTVGVPYLELTKDIPFKTDVNGSIVTLIRNNEGLTISGGEGQSLPFYFEMWFSFATQHGEDAIVFDPSV